MDVTPSCTHVHVHRPVIVLCPGYVLCMEPVQWGGYQSHHTHPTSQEERSQEIRTQVPIQPRLQVSATFELTKSPTTMYIHKHGHIPLIECSYIVVIPVAVPSIAAC